MTNGTKVDMSMSQMLSYTYLSALLSEMLIVRTVASSWLYEGIIIMSFSINKLSLSITLWWMVSIIFNLLITMVIIVVQSYLYASVTFYAPVVTEEISSYVIDAMSYIGNFPLSGMSLYLQFSLITVIPSGLMAWFPSLILLGKSPINLPVLYPLIIAIIFTLTASILFKKGLNYYVKKGEFAAYAGPNGAGKSTTMKLLCGMLLPTSGDISVLSMSPKNNRITLMTKVGVLFGNRTELWWNHPISQSFEWKKVVWNIPDDIYKRNFDMIVELLF